MQTIIFHFLVCAYHKKIILVGLVYMYGKRKFKTSEKKY